MHDPAVRADQTRLATPAQRALADKVWRRHRGSTDALIGVKRGLHWSGRQGRAFLRAMQEAFAYHYLRNRELQRLCCEQNFYPWHLRRADQVSQVPYFSVSALKHQKTCSLNDSEIVVALPSPATGDQASAITLDRTSLRRIQRIVRHIFADLKMVSRVKNNYLCYTHDPAVAEDEGTAFLNKLLIRLTGESHVCYALTWNPEYKEWRLNNDRVLEALDRFEASGRPFRLLGFPDHAWSSLERIVAERGRPYRFGPRSFVITEGGWQNFDHKDIDSATFREKVGRWLGIPNRNVRDLYRVVEHGVPYCECEKHRMHVPIYSKVFARDPVTLEVLPPGQAGLLQFVTPYLNSFPAISLLTTDRGRLHIGCRCGRVGPVVELLGRADSRQPEVCAMAALKGMD